MRVKSGRRWIIIVFVLFVVQLLAIGIAMPRSVYSTAQSYSGVKHVVLIMMENQNYQNIIGNPSAPFINSLANNFSLATNSFGVEYPSLPNYIDISSGSNGGITSDCTNGPSSGGCETSNTNIFSLLQSNGQSWMAYEESMPANCYRQDSGNLNSGGYYVHHNPVVYYTDVASTCAQNDVPLGNVGSETGAFFTALNGNSLPSFSFVTPNSCDDMHNCGISSGDKWLSEIIPDIIHSPSYSSTVTIITWDTGNCTGSCNEYQNGGGQVATIIVGPPSLVAPGKLNQFYNHYSVLATIESIFSLGNLGRNDAAATPIAFEPQSATTTTTSTATTTPAANQTSPFSVASVSLTPGGSIVNGYVTNAFWDVSLQAHSQSNFVAVNLTSSGANGTTFSQNSINGQVVSPNFSTLVSIEQLQPYAYVSLSPLNMTFAPPASGYNETLAPGLKGINNSLTTEFVNASSSEWTFYEAQGAVHMVYPLNITVQATGGAEGSWSNSIVANATEAPISVCNPNSQFLCVKVYDSGLFAGTIPAPLGLNDISNIYYQASPECSNWCGWHNATQAIQTGYSMYWYGPDNSFGDKLGNQSNNSNYTSIGQTCPSVMSLDQGHPGWAKSVQLSTSANSPTQSAFRYYPILPQVSVQGGHTSTSIVSQSGIGPGEDRALASYKLTNTVCGGLDLTDWLGASGVQPTSWGTLYNQGMMINDTLLVVNVPYGWNAPSNPELQILVPSIS